MDKIEVTGNGPLKGKINISGAKNSALKIMAASILTDDVLHLTNMPYLADITSMCRLLNDMGVKISLDGGAGPKGNTGRAMSFHAKELKQLVARYEIVKTFRASVVVLGPLLARFGKAKVSLPGGCAIGARPVDLHIKAMEQLGANIKIENGYIIAEAPKGLQGAIIDFPFVSVGATENTLMAATLAEGTTILKNCACEPEITDIANCLVKMGAKISGIGTSTLTIEGVEKLHGCTHDIIADRIEAGTYAVAALITNGEIELAGARREDLGEFIALLENTGAEIIDTDCGLLFKRKAGGEIKAVSFTTDPFPGMPTDLQAQLMTLMTLAEGNSKVHETIFENRFMHVPELVRMGAKIDLLHDSKCIVHGTDKLIGCQVMATDLRASASLIVAGLVAEGTTIVDRVYHLDRGYEQIEEKLSAVGAKIRRIK